MALNRRMYRHCGLTTAKRSQEVETLLRLVRRKACIKQTMTHLLKVVTLPMRQCRGHRTGQHESTHAQEKMSRTSPSRSLAMMHRRQEVKVCSRISKVDPPGTASDVNRPHKLPQTRQQTGRGLKRAQGKLNRVSLRVRMLMRSRTRTETGRQQRAKLRGNLMPVWNANGGAVTSTTAMIKSAGEIKVSITVALLLDDNQLCPLCMHLAL